MTINFRCEHCGKKVEAPDAAGGKRGRCPYCKQSCYIPSPVPDEELYDLAPEDEDLKQRQQREKEVVRSQEEALLSEMGADGAAPMPLEQRDDLKCEDLYPLVVSYCLDMAASKLQQADAHLQKLQDVGPAGAAAVDDFLTGKALEPALDQIPTKLLQGFLKKLRESLKD